MLLWTAVALAAPQTAPLTVWHAYRGGEAAAVEQVAAAYTAQTGKKVDVVALPFGAFDGKLETAIPRGNGPDVFLAAHVNLGKWVPMGLVLPWEAPLEGHRMVTREAVSRDGQAWGVPLAFKSIVLLYDPTRVTEVPRTVEELIAAAHSFTGSGHFGLAYPAADAYFHGAWMHAYGAHAIDPDGEVRLGTPAQTKALALSRRLAVDEGIAPKQPTVELVTQLYREGRVPFVINGPWFVAEVDRPIAAAPLPFVDDAGADAKPYLTVDAAFIAANGDDLEHARAFASLLAEEAGATVRRDVGKQAVSLLSVTLEDDPLLSVLAAQAEGAIPMPADPSIQTVFEAQARALRDVLRGAASPELAALAAQQYYEILSRPPPPPANPWPYVALVGFLALAAAAFWVRRLRDPEIWRAIVAHRWDYVWVAPAAVGMFLLVAAPFLVGASVSLFEHSQGDWSFVGLAHFATILLSRDFPLTSPLSFGFTLAVTVLWTVTNVFLHVTIGLALALLLREPWVRMRGVWRALLIVPWAVPNYITALIWKGMFHAQYGAINALLGLFLGRSEPLALDWFGSFFTAFAANLTTNTWLGFPFMMVVSLGALQSVPRDLEEAAEVDGASFLFRVRHVIWPLLQPALLPAIVLGSIWTFNTFNVVFLVSQGEPNGATDILVSDVYRWAFSRGNRYGYAAAYAVIVFFVLLGYTRLTDRLLARASR